MAEAASPTRARLLEAARELFTTTGYHATTTPILAKRAGAALHTFDVHLNVVGGLRIEEPAADLAIALSILSSYRDVALDAHMVAIGEIGLAGELRTVSQTDLRLREAARLGYSRAIVPTGTVSRLDHAIAGIDVNEAATVQEAGRLAGVQ